MKMKIKKSDRWAWFLLVITILMLIIRILGIAPIPWWVVFAPIWFPLVAVSTLILLLGFAVLICLILGNKGNA